MVGKLAPIVLTLLMVVQLNQPCETIKVMLDTTSSVTGLFQFIEELVGQLNEKPEIADQTLLAVQKMNDDVQYQLGEISKTLKNLPSIFDHVTKRNMLQYHVNHIGFAFKSAVCKMKDIETNGREDKSTYINFRKELESKIDNDIYEVQRMLLDDTTASYLTKTLGQGLKLFENVCETKMSHEQLLDSLLAKLKVAMAQYYMTKNMMYDFVQPYRKDPHVFNITRANLRTNVRNDYNNAVRRFKVIMTTASQELWRCDAPKSPRYDNKPGGPYYELMAFSKYMFNEGVYANHGLLCSDTKCTAITTVDDCGRRDAMNLCRETRKCPNNLIGCDNLHEKRDQLSYVCVNSNKTAMNRYTSFVPKDKVGELSCPDGKQAFLRDEQIGGLASGVGVYIESEYCNLCQCICIENKYYIRTMPVYADTIDQKVVTGAKLVVKDNTIYIQIQQGALLPNGQVNASTVEWKPIETHNNQERVPITWEGIRSIDLTSTKLRKDYLVAGFGFMESEYTRNRISLVTYSCQFLFHIGKNLCPYAEPYYDIFYKKSPEDELKLENVDVPTNSIKSNELISNDAQYVTFTITDMQKDGGQTTVPFIDTQEVVTNPPMPLAGAGLIHRGQEGYGGFLGLKLYTYHIVDHISEEPEFS